MADTVGADVVVSPARRGSWQAIVTSAGRHVYSGAPHGAISDAIAEAEQAYATWLSADAERRTLHGLRDRVVALEAAIPALEPGESWDALLASAKADKRPYTRVVVHWLERMAEDDAK